MARHGTSIRFTRHACVRALGALGLLLASTSTLANAQVFRCVDADGQVVFSDTGCGPNGEKVKIEESSGGLSPIKGDGLSAQEQGQLSAAKARAAQAASPSSGDGPPSSSSSSPSPSPSPSAHHY